MSRGLHRRRAAEPLSAPALPFPLRYSPLQGGGQLEGRAGGPTRPQEGGRIGVFTQNGVKLGSVYRSLQYLCAGLMAPAEAELMTPDCELSLNVAVVT